MRIIMMLALATALGASCADHASATGAPTAPTQTPALRTIVAFGDSLTSGKGLKPEQSYPAMLEKMLQREGLPFRVVNHGVSGDRTADGVRRLRAALDERPAILIVAFGVNDGLRGVPVAQVRANLETIIKTAQAEGVTVLLCGMEALPFYGFQYTLDFHRLFPALAEQYNVPLVPFMLEGVINNENMLQPDLHPNAAGAAEIARTIWAYLRPLVSAAAVQVTR